MTDSPFEKQFEKVDCPVRITSIVGYDSKTVQDTAQRLIDEFGWKYHSTIALRTIDRICYSILLWNTKP